MYILHSHYPDVVTNVSPCIKFDAQYGRQTASYAATCASSLFCFGLVGEDDDDRIWHDKAVLGAIYMNLCHPITVIGVTLDWQDFLPYG